VVVAWGPGEERLAAAVAAAAGPRALVAPPTGLFELMALLRRASLVVAGDTGPLHVAAALGRPCVGIYGPTRGWRNGPYGAGHRVVEGRDGRVDAVAVDDVAAAAGALLA
jgi:heptosyltransferase-1